MEKVTSLEDFISRLVIDRSSHGQSQVEKEQEKMSLSTSLAKAMKARENLANLETLVLIIFLSASTVITSLSSILAEVQTPMPGKSRVQLQERSGVASDPSSPLSHVSVFIEANQIQSNVSQGIELVMEIVNEGTETITLREPSEFSQIEVLNEEGWPIKLPPKDIRTLTNIRGRPGEPDPNKLRLEIRLAPGEQHRFSLRVQQILMEGTMQPMESPIPAGRYRVRINTLLMPVQDGKSISRFSKHLRSDFIIIQLGN